MAGSIACADAGLLAVKGFAEPVHAWRVCGARNQAHARRPFAGRLAELEQFRPLLKACAATGHGASILIRGEAGIGKSRLVGEWRHLAADAGYACHTAQVLDFGAGSARDAVRALLISLLSGATDERATPPGALIADARQRRLVADGEVVFLNDLLDVDQPIEMRRLYDAMSSADRNTGRRELFVELVRRASRAKPLLLIVEDLHWAQPEVLAYVADLTALAAACPALLVMTWRTEGDPFDPPWTAAADLRPSLTFDLRPLRPDEALELAAATPAVPQDHVVRCVARAAGNPLFLEQLLMHVAERLDRDVPGSVRSLVQARLDRLAPADKLALQAAAVFGQQFERDALNFLLEAPTEAPDRLLRQQLVRRQGPDGFMFAHALVRDATYDTLLKSRRQAWHKRAAAWFSQHRQPILAAEHLERAQDPAAPNAYLRAARSQADEYRYEPAIELAERGLALAGTVEDRFSLSFCRAGWLNDLGASAAALEAYAAALAEAETDVDRCRALLGLANVKRITDDVDGALADVAQAKRIAEQLSLTEEAARAHLLHGNLMFPRADMPGCLRENSRGLALARQAGSAELEVAALGGLGDAEYMRGRMRTAFGHFRRCVELSAAHGFGRIEVANRSMMAATLVYSGKIREALDQALSTVEMAAEVGHRRAELIAHMNVYGGRMALMQFDQAFAHTEKALQLARQIKAPRFEAEALAFRGDVHRAAGRPTEALRDLQEALTIGRATGMTYCGPWYLGLLAAAAEDDGMRREALAEGEALLATNEVAHNNLQFRVNAIEFLPCRA